jgi:hypothetical protein
MFVKKLELTADLEKMRADLDFVLTKSEWSIENQIGLSHRPGASNLWKDCVGSLWDRENNIELEKEEEFTEINPEAPSYTIQKLNELAAIEGFKLGRIRYMRLLPKTGLTVHADSSVRYHYVLETNEHSYIYHTSKNTGPIKTIGYHLPSDSNFYKVNTLQEHYVYNGGKTPRVHIVVCPITLEK